MAAAALAASACTVAALLMTTPWGDRLDSSSETILDYDNLREVRGAAWPAMLADSFAFAVIGLTLGLGVLHLVRTRGRVLALVGAVLTAAGGILFAMGGTAFATLGWFVTADGLAPGAGRSLVDHANDHPGHLLGPTMAGFALITLGVLVLAAALVRARAVPLVAVGGYVVLTLLQFAGLPGRAMDYLQVAMMVLLLGFAVLVWRRSGARPSV